MKKVCAKIVLKDRTQEQKVNRRVVCFDILVK